MQACDLLILASHCLPRAGGPCIEDAALAIDQDRILDLGPRQDLERRYTPQRHLDLGQSLILPGLINAHTHASMTLFRGLADDLPLMDWLEKNIWPREARLSPELVELGTLLAAAEMTRTGTTCFTDMYLQEEHVAKATDASGLRAVLSEGILEFPTSSYANIDEAFDKNVSLIERYANHPRISTAITSHAVYTNSSETMRRAFALAEEHDLPFMIHLAESQSETDICMERYGHRPLDRLESLGLLTSRTLMAHGVHLTDAELDRIATAGASIAHCPRSNAKLASGMARVSDMQARNINVALGTDGPASNNGLNLFTEMTAAALKDKIRSLEPTNTPSAQVLAMATTNGAKALNLPTLGALTPNGPADLIALDLTRPNLQPIHSLESHAVYAATGMENRLTMVAGEILYLDGEFTRLDWPALLDEADKVRDWALGLE